MVWMLTELSVLGDGPAWEWVFTALTSILCGTSRKRGLWAAFGVGCAIWRTTGKTGQDSLEKAVLRAESQLHGEGGE